MYKYGILGVSRNSGVSRLHVSGFRGFGRGDKIHLLLDGFEKLLREAAAVFLQKILL